ECTILLDRAAQCCSELILLELRVDRGESIARADRFIAHKVESATVKIVAARFRDDIDYSTNSTPELSRVVVGNDLKLLNSILTESRTDGTATEIVIIQTINSDVIETRGLAIKREAGSGGCSLRRHAIAHNTRGSESKIEKVSLIDG